MELSHHLGPPFGTPGAKNLELGNPTRASKFLPPRSLEAGQTRVQHSPELSPNQSSVQHRAQPSPELSTAQSSEQPRAQPSTELSPAQSSAQHRAQHKPELSSTQSSAQTRTQLSPELSPAQPSLAQRSRAQHSPTQKQHTEGNKKTSKKLAY